MGIRTYEGLPDAVDSGVVPEQIEHALQRECFRPDVTYARLEDEPLETACHLKEECWLLPESAVDRTDPSARAHLRILRVSRPVENLAQAKKTTPPQVTSTAFEVFESAKASEALATTSNVGLRTSLQTHVVRSVQPMTSSAIIDLFVPIFGY